MFDLGAVQADAHSLYQGLFCFRGRDCNCSCKGLFLPWGDLHECYDVFVAVNKHDIVSWTGIMTSCSEEEPAEAVFMFCQLRREGFEPDRHTFSIVVKACAGFATEKHSMALHSLVLKSGYGTDTVLCNALIHAYARCGNIKLAICIFNEMKLRDQVSWNSIIKAYAAHGKGKEALGVFQHMDFPPDSATFVGILTACSHCGYVNEGRRIFKEMSEVYGIAPQRDHFACMVDILGRAGKLLEAKELIDQMPIEADHVVWRRYWGMQEAWGEYYWGKGCSKVGGIGAREICWLCNDVKHLLRYKKLW
ncbi:hypothetical protein HPP92_023960 [Vanilla planifolia]|uniref:Pentatricopeptide repeat-containing protein n=1 Tax=Vanilla planifolia TaxID=51239 RepID=A0A835UC45_VANPL|nr:hypothetical protein HPP92_023960 [Vanilla planifolia]